MCALIFIHINLSLRGHKSALCPMGKCWVGAVCPAGLKQRNGR